MSIRRKTVTVASITFGTVALSIAMAAPALALTGYGYGYGSTAQIAHGNAVRDLISTYTNCSNIKLIYDTYNKTAMEWDAEVSGTCTGTH